MRISRLLLLAALPVAGCNITDSDFRERPDAAIIDMGPPSSPQVVVPTEVRAGELFTVRVTTYGDGCVRKGYVQTSATARELDVRPFDYFPSDDGRACTRELRSYEHEVSVRMETPGAGVVRVHGRRMTDFEPVIVTRNVTVTQ